MIKSLLSVIVIADGLRVLAASVPDMPLPYTLQAVIIPSTTNVRLREPFDMALRVENHGTNNETIRVMNCSWDEEWRSSNTNVTWMGWDCDKNFAVNVVILPGGAYTNHLQMLIYNLIPDKEMPFRMGFISIGSTNTLWSNEVILHL